MRLLLVLVLVTVSVGCRLQLAGKWGPAQGAYSGSIADVRISSGLATVDGMGVQTAMDKHAASPQFMSMIEKTAPGITEALANAVMSRGASTVLDTLSGLVFTDEDEVMKDIEGEMVDELNEKEKVRRTPEQKSANQAERGKRGNQ